MGTDVKKRLRSLWARIARRLRDATGWDEPSAAPAILASAAILATGAGCEPAPRAKPLEACVRSSNWDADAERRMMNILSPYFAESKVDEYLDWQQSLGCDHVHVLLVNGADGEGGGYDALLDDRHRRIAVGRVRGILRRGLGVVAWIVADDSDPQREAIFRDPAAYAAALAEYHPYISYVVLGLEMDEGVGSLGGWTALRDAVVSAGWTGAIATHHTAGSRKYARLGGIVMDQLHQSCTESDIAASVKALVADGYAVCGFEYARRPDGGKARAALQAGAFSCGNWGVGR